MVIDKHKILLDSIKKLLNRSAHMNIKKLLDKTHSADIADVLESLDWPSQKIVFHLVSNNEAKSEIISHLNKTMQTTIVNSIPDNELAPVLSHMDSDDLADLVGCLDDDLSEKIMLSLKKPDKEKVEDLLQHEEDSAGGIMTTELLKIDENLTISQAIEILQTSVDNAEATFYAYVVNADSKLVGVVSLKQILLSKPFEHIKNIMIKETIYVDVSTSQKDVARIVEKYDFLSVPVVGDDNVLLGAITVDDVIDVIREENKDEILAMGQTSSSDTETFRGQMLSRYPWLMISFFGGLVASYLVWSFLGFELSINKVFVSSIPLVLILGLTVSNQTVTIAVQHFRSSKFSGLIKYTGNEILLSLLASFLFSIIIYLLFRFFGVTQFNFFMVVAVSIGVQLFLSSFMGVLVPWILRRLQLDPAVGSLSIVIVLSHVLEIIFMIKTLHYFDI